MDEDLKTEQVDIEDTNEDVKETTDTDEKMYGAPVYDEVSYTVVPGGPTSFADLDAEQEAREVAFNVRERTRQFHQIVDNIMVAEEVTDKMTAISSLVTEFSTRVQDEISKEVIEKAEWSASFINNLPDSSFLYIEPGGKKDDEGRTTPRSLRHLPYKDSSGKVDQPHLRNAASRLGQSDTGKAGGQRWLTSSLRKRLQNKVRKLLGQKKGLDSLFDAIKSWWNESEIIESDDADLTSKVTSNLTSNLSSDSSFIVWKEGEQYRWFAAYSNRYRDVDRPPEILSSQAHRDFVKSVDDGSWPMPELWLWHVKGSRSGIADWLAYDEDTGFSLASGTLSDESIALGLSKMGQLAVSHGMPRKEIQRDPDDSTVITRYRTIEISPLPIEAAANKLTSIHLFTNKQEQIMAIPDEKKEWLRQVGLTDEQIAGIETDLKDKAETAKEQGLEFKGDQEQTETTEPTPEVEAKVTDETKDSPEDTSAPTPITRSEIIDAMVELVKPMQETIQALTDKVVALGGDIKSLQTTDEEKIQKTVESTPAASLIEILQSKRAVGNEKTRVDGRTSLAKGPKQAQESTPAVTGVGFIDSMFVPQQSMTD